MKSDFRSDHRSPGSFGEDPMSPFESPGLIEKWARVRRGLRQPRESGEHKWARLQVKRLVSPLSGALVPGLIMLLVALLAGMTTTRDRTLGPIRLVDDAPPPELDDPPDELPPPEFQPPDPQVNVETDSAFQPEARSSRPEPDVAFSPQPNPINAVAFIRSPVTLPGVYSRRITGQEGDSLKEKGGSPQTQDAALRALRWLKLHQEEDGRWTGTSGGGAGRRDVDAAMTGLALLTYLARGETPSRSSSPEFAETIESAMRWLVANQRADGGWARSYQHPIVTYALCEAYGMTRIPSVRAAAERGLDILIAGQNPQGGWRYAMQPTDPSDSSVMGWCVQALKAGQIAGLHRPGLEAAMKRAVQGWQGLFRGSAEMGGFGYTSPGIRPLTGIGVLSLQLLGAAQADQAQGGMRHLIGNRNTFDWNEASWRDIYFWYYDTQARFHEGGESWEDWNRRFALPLVHAQIRIPNAIADLEGNMADIGYWCTGNDRGGRVMDTTLSALQLMVYYRYLPTYQTPAAIVAADNPPPAAPDPVHTHVQL